MLFSLPHSSNSASLSLLSIFCIISIPIPIPSHLFYALGMFPIHWAALKGHPDIIEILLDNGSEVDGLNNGKKHMDLCPISLIDALITL